MKRFNFTILTALWIVISFCPGIFSFSAYGYEIIWYTFDMPPIHIPSGPYKDQGFNDLKGNIFREEMKNYSHTVKVANVKRIINDIAEKGNVIGVSMLKTPEREKVIEYSVPHSLNFTYVIMIEKDRVKEFQPYLTVNGSVMLEKLITESSLKLNLSLGRSYSAFIDEILKKYPTHNNITYRTSSDGLLEGILKMILARRADYTIAFPQEAYYLAKIMDKTESFVSLPIEGMHKYDLGYTVVPKNEWGRKILNELNPIILKHRNTRKFRGYAESWMDENMKKLFRKYMDETFGPVGDE
jgi:uncharacterized protein (TIGR02285 family)